MFAIVILAVIAHLVVAPVAACSSTVASVFAAGPSTAASGAAAGTRAPDPGDAILLEAAVCDAAVARAAHGVSLPAPSSRGTEWIVNGGFESGAAPWTGSGVVTSGEAHGGNHALAFSPGAGLAEQLVTLPPDVPYKLTAWIRIDPAFSGSDWGGIVLGAVHFDWSTTYQTEFFSPANRPVGVWFQETLTFTPSSGSLRIRVGFFGGSGWSPHFRIDDVSLRPLGGGNEPPRIETLTVSGTSGIAPYAVTVEATVVDDDGAVLLIEHDTGDGAVGTGASVTHTYGLGGDYLWRVTATDDEGASAEDSVWISVADAGSHEVAITAPTTGPEWETTAANVILAGTVAGGSGAVYWMNERTDQAGEVAVTAGARARAPGSADVRLDGAFTTPAIPLARGRNPLRVQSIDANGGARTALLVVTRLAPGGSGPTFGDVAWPAPTIGVNEPWECRFDLETVAENPGLAFDPAPPELLAAESGVSVDAVFTGPGGTYVQPAWLGAESVRAGDVLRATGQLRWSAAMAFPRPGVYTCRLRAVDALGESEVVGPSITVTPSDYPGFLRASASDDRYFEYDDGTPFFPLGYGTGIGSPAASDAEIATWSAHGLDFGRLWLSSRSPFSDAWSSWATHHAMPDNGYLPPSLRTSEERFGNGDFTWKLAAPAIPGGQTPAMFRGFWDGPTPVRPSTTYRVTARVRTRGVVGGGLRLETGGWLGEAVTQSGVGTALSFSLRGDSPWCYLWGDYTTGSNETSLPYLYLVLDSTTAGRAYCHRLTVQEVLPDGSLGGNVLAKPDADSHLRLDPIRSLDFDYLARRASAAGIHYKAVILEKDDWLLNQFDAFGRIDPTHAVFAAPPGTKLRRLYEHFWRHLAARWGAEPSVHSWELVNEGAPGSYGELTDALAAYFAASARPRMASTSFWCCWEPEYWAESAAAYGDVHAYVMTTGWIDEVVIDGEVFDRAALVEDPAAAVWAYSTAVGLDPARTKPVVIGETDLDRPGDQSPDPRLAADTEGMWLHDFNWAHLNPGGVPLLLWNSDNLRAHDLHHQYTPLRAFVRGIDWTTGGYVSAEAVASHPRMRAWGQRRADGSAAHLWVAHRDHTWARVLEDGPPAPISGTVTIPGMRPGPIRLETWNTTDTLAAAVEMVEVPADGSLVLNVADLGWDRAFRLGDSDDPTGAPPPDAVASPAVLLRVQPVPARRPVLALELPVAGDVRVAIYDPSGRRVHRVLDGRLEAGAHEFVWDGRLAGGQQAPAGVYFVRVQYGEERREARLVLVR